MNGLTSQQGRAMAFIAQYIATQGYSPSLGEVAENLCLMKSGAYRVVARLKDRGYLTWAHRHSRSFQVLQLPPGADVPLPGTPALSRASDDDLHRLRRDLAMEITKRTNDVAIKRADAITGASA